jgi:hypothetical protein
MLYSMVPYVTYPAPEKGTKFETVYHGANERKNIILLIPETSQARLYHVMSRATKYVY